MLYEEKCLESQRLYDGKVLNLRRDIVRLENGATATREVVEHNGGVGVLAIDEQNRVLMVRQYRYGIGRVSLEIPAGKREAGEDPALCGRRELEEETGCIAGDFQPFGSLDVSPAYDSEVIYLFLARALTPAAQNLDEDELLTVEYIPLAQALSLCMDGTITDAKTVIALLRYALTQQNATDGADSKK